MNVLDDNILKYINEPRGATIISIVAIILTFLVLLTRIFKVNIWVLISNGHRKIIRLIGKVVNRSEVRYHRDLEIGKINEKRARHKVYRFLNDLIIDLELKRRGATPYSFLTIVILGSALVSLILCQLVFKSLLMGIVMFPIIFAGIVCGLYTKANISHDTRIEDIIEAENIISNNIKDGVVVAVRNSIDVIPSSIREEFRDFLDNIEHKNYHIRTALLELNNNLGSTSDDFIKKCIVFELEEEHGIVEMFKDIVEINNIKSVMRTEMKRKFEEVSTEFVIGALMIFIFLGGTMAIFPIVSEFYLKTFIGRMLIALDLLIVLGEFVYITYLRAKEL